MMMMMIESGEQNSSPATLKMGYQKMIKEKFSTESDLSAMNVNKNSG